MKLPQLSQAKARLIWIDAQKLNQPAPFGSGPQATARAVEHLGYVQIDTINVIERCHHHILYNRIPSYKRQHLQQAQGQEKTVFEYWTHALSYVPTRDLHFFLNDMKRIQKTPSKWFQTVKKEELQRVLRLIKKEGALSIRDIEDDVLVEKNHPWASRKPSKKALQLGFYTGQLVISERLGMLKKYELTNRHFGWKKAPAAASEKEILEYLLERALRTQGFVSLDSICHLDAPRKPAIRQLIEMKVKKQELLAVALEGTEKNQFWIKPELFETKPTSSDLTHILSPFDPLIILRKRLNAVFDYNHLFEAYLPKEKRKMGYFTLPVLLGEEIVAALDLKADRQQQKLLMQKWNWVAKGKSASNKRKIEEELQRFSRFQLE